MRELSYQDLESRIGKDIYVPALGKAQGTLVSVETHVVMGVEVKAFVMEWETFKIDLTDGFSQVPSTKQDTFITSSLCPLDIYAFSAINKLPELNNPDFIRTMNKEENLVMFCQPIRRWVRFATLDNFGVDKDGNMVPGGLTPWQVFVEDSWYPITFDPTLADEILLRPHKGVLVDDYVLEIEGERRTFAFGEEGTIDINMPDRSVKHIPAEVLYGN